MLFAVVFTHKPDHGALRAEYLAAHIAWVDANKEQVLVAGSLRENPADVPRGGLWVVQAPEKADVHALMQTDLFLQLWFAPRCGGIALEQGA